jgi:hypothetical protein
VGHFDESDSKIRVSRNSAAGIFVMTGTGIQFGRSWRLPAGSFKGAIIVTSGVVSKVGDIAGQTANSVDDVENLLIPLTYISSELYRKSAAAAFSCRRFASSWDNSVPHSPFQQCRQLG